MSEILSQEQINSLLGQKDLSGGVAGLSDESSATASPVKDYDALKCVFELYD